MLYLSQLSSRAQSEIVKSWQWYEERQNGLGDQFVNEVIETIRSIEKSPYIIQLKFKEYREAPLSIFPYLIVYRISKKNKSIRIVSVFHTSLNPKKKYS